MLNAVMLLGTGEISLQELASIDSYAAMALISLAEHYWDILTNPIDDDSFMDCFGDNIGENIVVGMTLGAIYGSTTGAATGSVAGVGVGAVPGYLGGGVVGSIGGVFGAFPSTAVSCWWFGD